MTAPTIIELQERYEGYPDKRSSEAKATKRAMEELRAELALDATVVAVDGGPTGEVVGGIVPTRTVSSESLKTASYWIGTFPVGQSVDQNDGSTSDDGDVRPYPPRHNIVIAGTCFPTKINPITSKDKAMMSQQRSQFFGKVQIMTSGQVDEIIDELRRSWVRWGSRRGKRSDHGFIMTNPSERTEGERMRSAEIDKRRHIPNVYIPRVSDQPTSEWLYMVRVRDGTEYPPNVANENLPASIADVGIERP